MIDYSNASPTIQNIDNIGFGWQDMNCTSIKS